jgi:hypothetical protein
MLNLRQITGTERVAASNDEIRRRANEIDAIQAQTQSQSEQRKAGQTTFGTVIEGAEGRFLPIMKGGNVIGVHSLGQDPENYKPVPMIGADGKVFFHDVMEPVPEGAEPYVDPSTTSLRDATRALTQSNVSENQRQSTAELAKWKSWALSPDLEHEDKKAWVDAFNATSPDEMLVESEDSGIFGTGFKKKKGYKVVPKPGSAPAAPAQQSAPSAPSQPSQPTQNLPKPTTKEEFDAIPSGTKFINPADGRILTKK